jgi:hypothetical protein
LTPLSTPTPLPLVNLRTQSSPYPDVTKALSPWEDSLYPRPRHPLDGAAAAGNLKCPPRGVLDVGGHVQMFAQHAPKVLVG